MDILKQKRGGNGTYLSFLALSSNSPFISAHQHWPLWTVSLFVVPSCWSHLLSSQALFLSSYRVLLCTGCFWCLFAPYALCVPDLVIDPLYGLLINIKNCLMQSSPHYLCSLVRYSFRMLPLIIVSFGFSLFHCVSLWYFSVLSLRTLSFRHRLFLWLNFVCL